MKNVLTKFAFAILLGVLGCVVQARAATLTVTSAGDVTVGVARCADGCSLREAMAATVAGDIIEFSSLFNSPQIISLGGTLLVNRSMTINGPGAHRLTLRSNGGAVLLVTTAGTLAVVNGITFTDGSAVNGGGIGVGITTSLTLNSCVVTNSTASNFGGGIINSGNLTINNCTISNNTANGGGGIYAGGGTLTITNTTISGNTANSSNTGGGIQIVGTAADTVTITNSTITNNSASNSVTNGGGIYRSSPVVTTLRNTVVAGNVDSTNLANLIRDLAGSGHTSQGYNFIGNGSLSSPQPTDRTGNLQSNGSGAALDARLGPLGNYGATVPVHVPLFNSPLIDLGHASGSTTDQRGLLRPVDFLAIANASSGDGSDIGAYELQASPTAAPVSVSGRVLADNWRGLVNATVVLTDMRGVSRTVTTGTFGYFQFDDITAGETVVVSVSSKRYQFAPQVVTVNANIAGLNFVP